MKQKINKLEELNWQFDNLKMNNDYEEMLKFLDVHNDFLASEGWKVNKLIFDINTILTLHKGL